MRRCVAVVTHLSDGPGKAFPHRLRLAARVEGLSRAEGGPTPFARPSPEWKKHKNTKTKRKERGCWSPNGAADPLEEGALRRHLDEGFEALAYCMMYRFGR